jgi:competence ComEA-like helix-hairpin-helix protein
MFEATHAKMRRVSLLLLTSLLFSLEYVKSFPDFGYLAPLPSSYILLQGNSAALPAHAQRSSKLPPAPLDINLASAEDFQKLPGVGPKLARQIVAYRQKHGPFRRVEDLMAVRGMGIKKWKAIRPYIRTESRQRKD